MTREEYKQLLEPHLPPPILERAVRNFDNPRYQLHADSGRCSPSALVDLGFSWYFAPEGDTFWSDVHGCLRDGRYGAFPSMKGLPT